MAVLDDRTLAAGILAGVLAASSAQRMQRSSSRALQAQLRREMDAMRYSWRGRMTGTGATVTTVAALALVAYAMRRYRRAPPESTDAEIAEAAGVGTPIAAG